LKHYIDGSIGTTAFPMVLCHRLNVFCLPILLYRLEGVPISSANLQCIQHGE